MRVAFFINEFPTLSQPFVLNQITGMIDRGCDVDIYAKLRLSTEKQHEHLHSHGLMDKTRFFSDMPAPYVPRLATVGSQIISKGLWKNPGLLFRASCARSGMHSRLGMRFLYDAITVADRKKYDIIHCQFGTLGPMALKLKQVGAIDGKLVTSFRGFDITKHIRTRPGFYNELFDQGDLFLPVSRSLRNALVEAGCSSDKIKVIHSGIDCGRFQFTERHLDQGETVRLLGIGRFVEKKGFEYAIQALRQVVDGGVEARLTLIGDGDLRPEIEKLVEELSLADEVRFVGWRDHTEIVELLGSSHIFVAPSVTARDGDQEGIPNVLKEAMASGMPVVSTYHSGIPELVEDGESGYLVPERDTGSLAARIIDLCQHPDKWARFGKNARNKIEKDFDTERINDSLARVYAGIVV